MRDEYFDNRSTLTNSYINQTVQKMYRGKIDWNVAKRLLEVIHNEGPIRPTRLAMKACVNYDACKRYITWMIEIDWVKIDSTQGNTVTLTEFGSHTIACLDLTY